MRSCSARRLPPSARWPPRSASARPERWTYRGRRWPRTAPEMRERRLVFGEAADLYDRHRPAYPEQLIDELVGVAGLDGRRAVLEVGAGTGKATLMFAARGI